MSETSDRIRREFGASDQIRDYGLTTPKDVVRYDDLLYGTDLKWQKLDVYRPKRLEGKLLPMIFSVHGGAWVYGDKELYQYYCMSLAQRGFAVVNFTYRLAPEFLFPAPLEDTNLVIQWILAHAKVYGFDTEHIFGVGDSAGAQILALYSAACTNPDFAKEYDFEIPTGFRPTAVALNCGDYQTILQENPSEQTRNLMADYLPEKGSAKERKLIDIEHHLTEAFPPVFLMTATGDFLQSQAPLMASWLLQNKIEFIFRFYGDARHSLGHVFHCNGKLPEAALCNDEECDFFHRFC